MEKIRVATIGDIHGRDCWKSIDFNAFDIVVFLGDYLDSFDINKEAQLQNLKDIISLQRANPNKVILLLGNHDIQYVHFPKYMCSGYQQDMLADYFPLLKYNPFQVAFQIGNHLWTHAGVHEGWLKYRMGLHGYFSRLAEAEGLASALNKCYPNYPELFDICPHRSSFGSTYKVGGIFWADFEHVRKKPAKGYHQLVGHNMRDDIKTFTINPNTSITFCDVLDKRKAYVVTEFDRETRGFLTQYVVDIEEQD
jgi:hypothetical protein